MRPRFLADADFNHKIIVGLRRRERLVDLLSAHEGGVIGASDPEVLRISSTGNPAISVPAGFTTEGLPVGLQIVGRHQADFSVLQIAHVFEQATGFGKKRPSIL